MGVGKMGEEEATRTTFRTFQSRWGDLYVNRAEKLVR